MESREGSRTRLIRLRRLAVALVATALVLAVLGVVVPKWKQARAEATHADQCQVTATQSAARNRIATGDGRLRVTVLGDSYAQGYLLDHPSQSWPSRLTRPLGARVMVRSLGGTGFVASPCRVGDDYPDRASGVASTRPDLVVVEGGLNDVLAGQVALATGLRRTLAALPSVRVVVVGPAAAPKWLPQTKAVDRTLAAAAHGAGVQYISAYGWPLTFASDGLHLTAASQRVFGDRVAAAISATGP